MNEINDSNSHQFDGVDRDDPRNRHRRSFQFPEAANLVDDLQELRQLDEADVRHYCAPLPNSGFIKR